MIATTLEGRLRWAVVVLYRQRRLLATVFAAVVLLGVAYTLVVPPVFRAESKLLVTINRAPLAVSPEVNARQQPIPQVREEDLNSVVAMLGGRELVRDTLQAVAAAPGEDSPSPGALGRLLRAPAALLRGAYFGLHGRNQPSALDRQVTAVAERLQVTPVRRSNVVAVAFEDHDPEWAARFLDRFLSTFLDAYARAVDPSRAEAFFEEQTDLLATRLHASEEALKSFRGRSGIVSLEDQRRSVVGALAVAESEYDRVRVELAGSRSRLAAIGATLPQVDRFVPTARREVHEATSVMRGHLMMLEVERAELLSDYTEESVRVRELDEQIAAARGAFGEAQRHPVEEKEYGLNKTFEALSVERALETARVEEYAARLAALGEQIGELRARAVAFDGEAIEIERLERDRAIDENVYSSYLQQREAARLSNALNQSQILNLAVAAPALTPSAPVRPKLRVNLLIALLLGAALGAFAAFARDARTGVIDFPEDIEHGTGLDVLGVVAPRR
jgi:tyrosine-protein kinase Etk/Wzc